MVIGAQYLESVRITENYLPNVGSTLLELPIAVNVIELEDDRISLATPNATSTQEIQGILTTFSSARSRSGSVVTASFVSLVFTLRGGAGLPGPTAHLTTAGRPDATASSLGSFVRELLAASGADVGHEDSPHDDWTHISPARFHVLNDHRCPK